ncbi:MAG: hypothetical protein Q8N79_09040 [Candidatus Methanoperedens sp.]|nr:hypothetical protein [Candidatus Methanoperedens sp.]
MKEIAFIDGKTKIRIKDDHLSAYLERIEAAGYVVRANKCKGREGFRDVLMIGGIFQRKDKNKRNLQTVYTNIPPSF